MGHSPSKAFRWRGVIAVLLLGPALVAVALSPPIVAEGTLGDVLLDSLAWTLFLTGAVLRMWATLYIGGRKGDCVVREGPYSLCRHPLYVGTFLIALSTALFLASPTVLIAVGALAMTYSAVIIPVEEQHLLEHLGKEYDRYCRETPRLLLRFRKPASSGWVRVRIGSVWLEFKRSLRWLFIPIACEWLTMARMGGHWPHLLSLP